MLDVNKSEKTRTIMELKYQAARDLYPSESEDPSSGASRDVENTTTYCFPEIRDEGKSPENSIRVLVEFQCYVQGTFLRNGFPRNSLWYIRRP